VLTPDIYQLLHRRNVIRTGARYYIGLRKVYLNWKGPGPSKYELDRCTKHIRYILDVNYVSKNIPDVFSYNSRKH